MHFWIWNILGNCKDLSLFLLELIEKKFSLILGAVGLSFSIASFFSSLWVSILPCVGYNLSVAIKMSEESRIRSCSSEISDNLNLFSITHIEYGLSSSRSQLNSELLSSGVLSYWQRDFSLENGFRISHSCSGVNICACDKSHVFHIMGVPERNCLILQGVKTVKCQ